MKQQIKKKKRETLPKLLAKSLCVAAALSAAFGFGYSEYLRQSVRNQTEKMLDERFMTMQYEISRAENDPEIKDLMQYIDLYMSLQTYYYVDLPVFFLQNSLCDYVTVIQPDSSENCYAVSALLDWDENIAASSRELLMMHIRFQDGTDPDKGYYTCDHEALNIPEVTKLYETYAELEKQYFAAQTGIDPAFWSDAGWPEIHIDSVYVDRETRRMIPHTGSVTVRTDEPDKNSPLVSADKTFETFEINVDDDAYELIEVHYDSSNEYPCALMPGIPGTESKVFHELTKDWIFLSKDTYLNSDVRGHEENTEYIRSAAMTIAGEPYYLAMHFYVNLNDPVMMQCFWRAVIPVAALLIALALLWSWRQNVVNKAKYAFDDMQRDLTNHLAHDIKTPLTAIGGYAENILDGRLSADEQQQYLKSILDNVAFTDQLISRTLFLNSMDTAQKSKPEKLQAEQITEEMLKKYELMLSERGIGYSVQGCAAITADRAALETVIENLVSNAVKYTPNDGSIRAQLDKKRLTLANSVEKKIAVGNLKRPFVRGDEARSNTEGTGLGLAIAEQTALANGWKLTLSCTDKDFIAELKW